jgi:hypothetical protein
MSGAKTPADICDELSAVFMEVSRSGRAHEMIDELVATIEEARLEIAGMTCRRVTWKTVRLIPSGSSYAQNGGSPSRNNTLHAAKSYRGRCSQGD